MLRLFDPIQNYFIENEYPKKEQVIKHAHLDIYWSKTSLRANEWQAEIDKFPISHKEKAFGRQGIEKIGTDF